MCIHNTYQFKFDWNLIASLIRHEKKRPSGPTTLPVYFYFINCFYVKLLYMGSEK